MKIAYNSFNNWFARRRANVICEEDPTPPPSPTTSASTAREAAYGCSAAASALVRLFAISFLFLLGSVMASTVTKQQLNSAVKKLELDIPIRVLLDEKPTSDVKWRIAAPTPFIVYSPFDKTKTVFQSAYLMVTFQKGSFYINGIKQTGDHLFIIPFKGPISFDNSSYDGIFALTRVKETAYVVNHVDLEDYVLSVLPYESVHGWPDEVQKAFCVAFRSYGIAKVLESRAIHERKKLALPYDIKNTNHHQIYKGRMATTMFRRIVDDTRGIVLAYKERPILAMFDICCGGVIPAHTKGLDFKKAPYLQREYACNHCKVYKWYSWTKEYTFYELEQELKKEFHALGILKDVRVTAYDDAGVAREIKCRGTHQWFTVPASKIKALFKTLPSLCFKLSRSGRSLVVKGKGHGHLVGLCQRGAHQLVLKGWKWKNVLKFYYPHATFMKLQKIRY